MLAGAAAANVVAAVFSQTRSTGRLEGGDPVSVGQPVEIGQPFSSGLLWLTNRSSSPVFLDQIELVEGDNAIKVVGSYVQRNNRHAVGFNKGYSPKWGEPFRQAEVAPGKRIQIVIGLVLSRAGVHRFRAIDVSYRTNSEERTTRFPVATAMCAPASRYGRCAAPMPLMD